MSHWSFGNFWQLKSSPVFFIATKINPLDMMVAAVLSMSQNLEKDE